MSPRACAPTCVTGPSGCRAVSRGRRCHERSASGPLAVRRAKAVLDRVHLLCLDDALLDSAGALDPAVQRSLDAIHLAAARTLGDSLEAVVTYDKRMADAALLLGLPVSAPS